MRKTRMQRGITLVALIITIVLLLILAVVTINTLQNEGVIGHAGNATNKYNEAVTNEQGILQGYLNYLEPNAGGSSTGGDSTVREWKKTAEGITDGTVVLQIGDYVKYNQGTSDTPVTVGSESFTVDTSLEWRVLGVTSDGKLELISSNQTTDAQLLSLNGEEAYLSAESTLNGLCNILYGQGEYAEGARSLNIIDVNTLAGINTEEALAGAPIYEYRVPTGGTNIQFRSSTDNGTSWTEWTDGASWISSFRLPGETEILNKDNPSDEGIQVKMTRYSYSISEQVGNEAIWEMLSKGTEYDGYNQYNMFSGYWLASTYVDHHYNGISMFGAYAIDENGFISSDGYVSIWNSSSSGIYGGKRALRPVVTLKATAQLSRDESLGSASESSANGWTIK